MPPGNCSSEKKPLLWLAGVGFFISLSTPLPSFFHVGEEFLGATLTFFTHFAQSCPSGNTLFRVFFALLVVLACALCDSYGQTSYEGKTPSHVLHKSIQFHLQINSQNEFICLLDDCRKENTSAMFFLLNQSISTPFFLPLR